MTTKMLEKLAKMNDLQCLNVAMDMEIVGREIRAFVAARHDCPMNRQTLPGSTPTRALPMTEDE